MKNSQKLVNLNSISAFGYTSAKYIGTRAPEEMANTHRKLNKIRTGCA